MSVESTVKSREQREKERRDQLADDMRHVLSTAQGRRLLWHVVQDICHINVIVAGESAFLEGQRSVGVELASSAKRIDFQKYQLMESEDHQAQLNEMGKRHPEAKGAITETESETGE